MCYLLQVQFITKQAHNEDLDKNCIEYETTQSAALLILTKHCFLSITWDHHSSVSSEEKQSSTDNC